MIYIYIYRACFCYARAIPFVFTTRVQPTTLRSPVSRAFLRSLRSMTERFPAGAENCDMSFARPGAGKEPWEEFGGAGGNMLLRVG